MTSRAIEYGELPVPHILSRVWRRQDEVALEHFNLQSARGLLLLSGQIAAAIVEVPYFVSYTCTCDQAWMTLEARVHVTSAGKHAVATLARSVDGLWIVNGEERSDLTGAIDLDIQWTPATNALPINRLKLEVGESQEVDAVWIRLPELAVERLSQKYTRSGETSYRYESNEGRFVADLVVDETGFVERYADVWACVGRG